MDIEKGVVFMEVEKKLLICKRDGLLIRGMQYLPAFTEGKDKYPAIIISHGFSGNFTDGEPFAVEFARMGYVVFCFSFCGGSSITTDESLKSEGKTTDMTIWTEVEDLIAVKDYAKGLPYVDEENLILMGFSQGGFVSGLAAARCKDEIKKLIMVYPALCIPDHARRGCLAGASYDPQNVPDIIDCGNMLLGRNYHDTVVNVDSYLELEPYEGPVLIIQGLEDTIVNYSYAIRAKESYYDGQCELMLVKQLGHGFQESQQESAVALIGQFLKERKEILSFRVMITWIDTMKNGDKTNQNIYFTGYCDTPYFQGAITPEGCDEQEYVGDIQTKMRAEYTLVGMDSNHKVCSIHIVNQRAEEGFEPTIKTDSEVLSWLNDAKLHAVLEGYDGGLTVRIFADGK